MVDVMAAIRERKEKALSKLARARKSLSSAEKELDDVLAAERVMAEITGESPAAKPAEGGVSERDIAIAKLLPTDKDLSKSPAELHPIYVKESGDPISLETFRTAIWRLLKKVIAGTEKSWIVRSEGGKYWREAIGGLPEEFDDIDGDDGGPFA